MTGPRADRGPLTVAILLLAGTAALIALTTPWGISAGLHPLPAGHDFPAGYLARSHAYHAQTRPLVYGRLAAGLLIAGVLGLTRAGAAIVARLGGRRRWRQAVAGTAALVALTQLSAVPFDARLEAIDHGAGLSLASWPVWAGQQAEGIAVSALVAALVALVFYALAGRLPRTWWAWAAAGGAALVVLGSLLVPITVERLTTRVRVLPASPLEASLLALAHRDGVALRHILVSTGTAPSTLENAYTEGIGPTRRIVLYGTFLAHASPAEVRVVFAHELGHVHNNDVWHGTAEGALAVAAAICCAPALLRSRLAARAGSSGPADPRGVGLALLVISVVTLLSLPVQDLVSRRIEARADLSALTLTRDPLAFVREEVRIDRVDLISPDPPAAVQIFFGTHPTPVQRLAFARRWAAEHHLPVPPALTGRSAGGSGSAR